jgi:hypothetical protein
MSNAASKDGFVSWENKTELREGKDIVIWFKEKSEMQIIVAYISPQILFQA